MSSEAIALWTETSSDPELIAGVRAGDSAAFGVLYERHAAAARKVAAQYTNVAADVDDVVSEAFSRVLRALQRGDGPDLAFRAYLFTIVRRTGLDTIDRGIRTKPRDDMSPYESALGYEAASDEPAIVQFEQSMVADAFSSLPERWQAVLWYTEVEKKSPKEIAPLLGLSANGVAALAYRAREALRQGYLQQHLNGSEEMDCLAANAQLGAYVRGGLSKREHTKVDDHVRVCDRCTALVAELEDVNRGMRGIVAPLILGAAGMSALDGGLPIGGVYGPPGPAASQAGVQTAGSGGTAPSAMATGSATAGGSASAVAGGASVAGVVGAVAQLTLPAAAVVGAVALAISGAGFLGLIGDDPALGENVGGPAVVGPTVEPTPSGDGLGPETPASSPPPTPSPSPEPSAEPEVDDVPSTGDPGDTIVPPVVASPASPPEPKLPTPLDPVSPPGGGGTGNPGTGGPGTGGPGTGGPGGGPGDGGTDPTDPVDPEDPTDPVDPEDPTDPDPPPPPPPPGTVLLSIGKAPLDYLEISRTSPQIVMTVANDGDGQATGVTATVELPDGLVVSTPAMGGAGFSTVTATRIADFLRFARDGEFAVGAWLCVVSGSGTTAECELPSLAAQSSATLALPVSIATADLAGEALTSFEVRAGEQTTTYQVYTALEPTTPNGTQLPPIYAERSAGLDVRAFGGTVMGCYPDHRIGNTSCLDAMNSTATGNSTGASNNNWAMVQLNADGGTRNSGTTTVTLPEGAIVKAASLEWSANRHVNPGGNAANSDSWLGALDTAYVGVNGGGLSPITADSLDTSILEQNRQYYLARADITDLVSQAGSGVYTVADIAVADPDDHRDNDRTYYGGFALTIVYEDPAIDETSTVALFQGPHWVKSGTPAEIRFFGRNGSTVTPTWTVFEGDRGNTGDSLRLNGIQLTPHVMLANGQMQTRLANDAADAWANGSPWGNTLGIDAHSFTSVTLGSTGIHTVQAVSSGDNYMIGSLAVRVQSAP